MSCATASHWRLHGNNIGLDIAMLHVDRHGWSRGDGVTLTLTPWQYHVIGYGHASYVDHVTRIAFSYRLLWLGRGGNVKAAAAVDTTMLCC